MVPLAIQKLLIVIIKNLIARKVPVMLTLGALILARAVIVSHLAPKNQNVTRVVNAQKVKSVLLKPPVLKVRMEKR